MVIVGDREVEAGAISVRSHDEGDLGSSTVAELARRSSIAAAVPYTRLT